MSGTHEAGTDGRPVDTGVDTGGMTRRDLLRRGAVLGGTLMWAAPAVQVVGMSPAFAAGGSPEPCKPGISYIAMNVTCGNEKYVIKWEAPGSWDPAPGSFPFCDGFTPDGEKANGASLGFEVTINPDGTATIEPGPNCEIENWAVKGGQVCSYGSGTHVSCPSSHGSVGPINLPRGSDQRKDLAGDDD